MTFGIPQKSIELIIKSLEQFKEIEKASIFGSRAIGNHKPSSDVDIAVYGDALSFDDVLRLTSQLNEVLPTPYYFDVVHYETLSSHSLKEHIDQNGVPFYERKQ